MALTEEGLALSTPLGRTGDTRLSPLSLGPRRAVPRLCPDPLGAEDAGCLLSDPVTQSRFVG